jgi:hypothetical protein
LATDHFLVLGEKLVPPEGFAADSLLATTFSLDLAAALALPLALIRHGQFAGRTVDTTSRLAVLEAIKRFAPIYRVFCDAGAIHVPSRRWRALALLDEVVVPARAGEPPRAELPPQAGPNPLRPRGRARPSPRRVHEP